MRHLRHFGRSAILAGAALALLPALASAQPGPGRHFGRPGFGPEGGGAGAGFMAGVFDRLDLSEEQRDAVQGVIEAGRDEGIELHRNVWEQRRILGDATEADVLDEGAIRAAAAALGQAEADVALHRARQMQQLREILTPEQVAELREMRARMEGRREGMRERFHPGWHHPG